MINCQQIHQDIANFRAQFEQIQQIFKYIDETAKKPANLTDSLEQIQATSDKLLTTYLADIYDAYPDLNKYTGGKYDQMEDLIHKSVDLYLQISDRQVIVYVYDDDKYHRFCLLTVDNDNQADYVDVYDYLLNADFIYRFSDRQIVITNKYFGSVDILTINNEDNYDEDEDNYDEDNKERAERYTVEVLESGPISCLLQLQDRQLLVCGKNGETRFLTTPDDNTKASVSNNIDGFTEYISSLEKLSDNRILVKGAGDELRLLLIDGHGKARYGEDIEQPEQSRRLTWVISDNNFLIQYYSGDVYIFTVDNNNHTKHSNVLEGIHELALSITLDSDQTVLFDKYNTVGVLSINDDGEANYNKGPGFDDEVFDIFEVPNNRLVVFGENGTTRILAIDNKGEASYSDNIPGIETQILDIRELSDSQFLVFGDEGETRILTITADNASYSEDISKNNKHNTWLPPHRLLKLPDNKFLKIGANGETQLLTLTTAEPSLEHLKQNLDKIIKKS